MIIDLLSIAFPSNCVGCQKSLVKGETHICLECYMQIPFINNFLLNPDKWLAPLKNAELKLGALFFYDKKGITQTIIHEIKYNNNLKLAKYLGETIGVKLKEHNIVIDTIIPVPLHKKKEKQRGFNQATEISKGISAIIEAPILTDELLRMKYTQTQTQKNKESREKNMLNAFRLKESHNLSGKNILIVDDVITTGATVNECLKTLTKVNGINIIVISLGVVKI